MIEQLKRTAAGAMILKDWLGDGAWAVPSFTAERRAKICEICPLNVAPGWWNRMLTNPIAAVMRKWIEAKNGLGLRVSVESELHVCRACGCALPTKVWTPIEHIKKHTSQEALAKYHNACWVPEELKTA